MIRVVLLGGGNLATHLANAFASSKEVTLLQVYNRTLKSIAHLSPLCSITDNLEALEQADITVIAVSDTAIGEVAEKVTLNNGLLVHTSGAMSIDILKNALHSGVLYPLQSFTKGKEINFKKIPLCIETKNPNDLDVLKKLAASISDHVYQMSSDQRKKTHVAAVFVNNFVNHLYKIGEDICIENKIPFEVLHPLIEETATKIKSISPKEAQTGPASRKDKNTLALHEQELDNSQIEIYKLLSTAILKETDNGSKL